MKLRFPGARLVAALASLSTVVALGCSAGPAASAPRSPVGAPVPHVALMSIDGRPTDLDAIRAGKPALVSFWATWCEACRKEFDALNRLDERVKSGNAIVIGINVGETSPVAAAFVKSHDLRYVQLVDEGFVLADALGQRQVPTTLVLDRDGHIVYSGGTLDENALVALRHAMNEKAP